MVSLKTFLTTSAALILAFVNVEAAVSPTYPSPGTIQIEGQTYDITWNFMTGSNDAQTKLESVATNVSASALKYTFVAPKVTPNAAIYFFMFTGSDGVSSWTTRFGIAGADGKLTKETESTQPNGDAIPWGTGKLVSSSDVANANASSITPPVVPASSTANATSSSVASVAEVAVADASSTTVQSSTAKPSSAVPVPSAAQVASKKDANSGSMVKPSLALVSAAVAAYLSL
ncbi:hypothetical protein [Parasitella parasitica]|uniref:Ser-Thr-rich glycosyl-phosphatidyl-inositol-anchored membrane family-domain-containing protein n=1 Tax=Parasitella parasitica TaxID=35722 RepID=A0A0B7NG43_9FUNG|nr:hypothetical protein [Parasitella parasitica]